MNNTTQLDPDALARRRQQQQGKTGGTALHGGDGQDSDGKAHLQQQQSAEQWTAAQEGWARAQLEWEEEKKKLKQDLATAKQRVGALEGQLFGIKEDVSCTTQLS